MMLEVPPVTRDERGDFNGFGIEYVHALKAAEKAGTCPHARAFHDLCQTEVIDSVTDSVTDSCECGNPLPRPNARYCSQACKQKAYRKRSVA